MRRIYWNENDLIEPKIRSANIDGSDAQDIITKLSGPYLGLSLHSCKFYWADASSNSIGSADYDGSNIEDLINNLGNPSDITIFNNKIYFTEDTGNKISVANLDGTDKQDLITELSSPDGIAIANGKIYWANSTGMGGNEIGTANLDGSMKQTIISGLNSPWDIAIDIGERKIYWSEFRSDGKIRRANLDGTNIEDVITGIDFPTGIVLDFLNQMIFWAEFNNGRIRKAKLNGVDPQNVITGLNHPMGILLSRPCIDGKEMNTLETFIERISLVQDDETTVIKEIWNSESNCDFSTIDCGMSRSVCNIPDTANLGTLSSIPLTNFDGLNKLSVQLYVKDIDNLPIEGIQVNINITNENYLDKSIVEIRKLGGIPCFGVEILITTKNLQHLQNPPAPDSIKIDIIK